MQVISNEKLIERNSKIGLYLSIAGAVLLAVDAYLGLAKPELYTYTFAGLILGFFVVQVGLYFTNRWGRVRAPDKLLTQALKGFDKRHILYHYSSPASHLLVGPSGVWVLLPKYQRGTITYEKNRWKQRGGGIWLAYLKLMAQEGIGRPDLEIGAEVDAVRSFLKKHLPEESIPPIKAALVFTNPSAEVKADNAPIPTVTLKGLKEAIRKEAKRERLSPEKFTAVQEALAEAYNK